MIIGDSLWRVLVLHVSPRRAQARRRVLAYLDYVAAGG